MPNRYQWAWAVMTVSGALAPPAWAQSGFSGIWETSVGRMELIQTGQMVRGRYVHKDRDCSLSGQVVGARLTFYYREPESTGEGWFELSEDGASFTGKWRPRDETDWRNWKGTRVADLPPPPPSPRPDLPSVPSQPFPPDDKPRRDEKGADELTFTGLWDTDFGRLRLLRMGDQVVGTYELASGSFLEGMIEKPGSRMTFQYREPNASGEGWFELAGDGTRLKGKWRPKGETQWSDWNGQRVEPRRNVRWLVVIESRWEESLIEPEFSFGQMLESFFARTPHVQVRRRIFNDEADLRKWLAAVSLLAEPTVVVVAAHGKAKGVMSDEGPLRGEIFGESLRMASNVELLHFSSCRVMRGVFTQRLFDALAGVNAFPVSGYETAVDWSLSAVADFMYLDLVLARDLNPKEAARQLHAVMPIVGAEGVRDVPLRPAGFKIETPKR